MKAENYIPRQFVLSAMGILLLLLFLISCEKEVGTDIKPEETYESLDDELNAKLLAAANGQGLSYFILPDEQNLGEIPQDPKNPLTPEKIELGKLLFHEPAIGRNPRKEDQAGTYSCASCHHAAAGFQAGVRQGVGEGGIGFGQKGEQRQVDPNYGFDFLDIQPIRTPSTLNTAYQDIMLWNGQLGNVPLNEGTEDKWALRSPKALNFLGFEGLEIQAIAGIVIHRQRVDKDFVAEYPEYKTLFDQAFPEYPESQRYNDTIAGLAIAAYERTMLANQAPFQDWLQGNQSAMSDIEKQGAILFFDKAGCVDCHTGPALNKEDFYALGMNDLVGEGVTNTVGQDFFTSAEGRGGFTGKESDLFKFKVPQLYNMTDSPFLGHGGSFRTVREVVVYKNEAIPENSIVPREQLPGRFKPLGLTEEEIDQLTAFLEKSLYDPSLIRYVPEQIPSGMCFPNADPASREDLGCE
ncbi:MAG TPA: cytochrome c peroxidase [Saprospiraceae bacterium]|nr:cytochrome c peroxidase [Saprospiraceae bacterium]